MKIKQDGQHVLTSRLEYMSGINVDRVGRLADVTGKDILRLENLDTDLPLPEGVVEATIAGLDKQRSNSYLPFFGSDDLRSALKTWYSARSGLAGAGRSTIVTAGGLTGILNSLLALLEPGDEVLVQDPVYIGLLNRIRLAGGVPVFLDHEISKGRFRLARGAIDGAISDRTRAMLLMSPVMPSGAVLDREDWIEIADRCVAKDLWLIYNAAMERFLYEGEYLHPARLPGLEDRTITIGSFSKEFRMTGWRVGWIDAPRSIADDIALVCISNVVCQVGIAQQAAIAALRETERSKQVLVDELRARRDFLLKELSDFRPIVPTGGWSLLIDCEEYDFNATEASRRLLENANVGATPITGWGSDVHDRYLRLVFSNEPLNRLEGIGNRFRDALTD